MQSCYIQGGSIEFSPPLLQSYVGEEGVKILLTHPVCNAGKEYSVYFVFVKYNYLYGISRISLSTLYKIKITVEYSCYSFPNNL